MPRELGYAVDDRGAENVQEKEPSLNGRKTGRMGYYFSASTMRSI